MDRVDNVLGGPQPKSTKNQQRKNTIGMGALTPPKCGELSEYTDSAHTEVEDLSSRCINGSDVYDRCGNDTRQFKFILSALPVGGLPIFKDRLDGMKLVNKSVSHTASHSVSQLINQSLN